MEVKDIVLIFIEIIFGITIIVLTPTIYTILTKIKEKIILVIGESAYNYAKNFVTDIIKSHPDIFSENEIVEIIDLIDNKFGDYLTKDEIKKIIDVILSENNKTISPNSITFKA